MDAITEQELVAAAQEAPVLGRLFAETKPELPYRDLNSVLGKAD